MVEVSKSQSLIVFGLTSGLIGVLQMDSSNPNWFPSNDRENDSIPFDLRHNIAKNSLNFPSSSSKNRFNLQLHETLNEMTVTSIKICNSVKHFYVGTSQGIVSCFKYDVS